jgi:hypothetical protein
MYGRMSWGNAVAVKSKTRCTPNQLTPGWPASKNRYVVCTLIPAEDGGQFVEFELIVTCAAPDAKRSAAHGTVPGGVIVPPPTSTRLPNCGASPDQLFPKYWTLPPSGPRLPQVSTSYESVTFDPPIQFSVVIASVSASVFHVTWKLLVVTVLVAGSIETFGTALDWGNAIRVDGIAIDARKIETLPKMWPMRVMVRVIMQSPLLRRCCRPENTRGQRSRAPPLPRS